MALQHIHTDLGLLELRAYDGVLGIDWLDFFSPMNCDWCGKVISFDYQGKWGHTARCYERNWFFS
jgi:hypothetical protein